MDIIEKIRKAIAVHPARILEPGDGLNSAVAVILQQTQAGLHILFIERSTNENDPWSGQIAFPGGKSERGDGSLRHTAERETWEELGEDLTAARFLGRLDDVAPAGLAVTVSCFVYAVARDQELHLNISEVASAFWTPVSEICQPSRFVKIKVSLHDRLRSFPAIRLSGDEKPPLWGITYTMFRNLHKVTRGSLTP